MLIRCGSIFVQGAEGGDFNQFLPHHHMHNLEASPDDAGAAATTAHLFRCGVRGDIKIFRVAIQQEVAHGTTNHISAVTSAFQILTNPFGTPAQHVPGNAVCLNRNDRGVSLNSRGGLTIKNLFDETADH